MPSLMKIKNGCGSFALATNSVHGIWHTSNKSAASLWDHCYLNLNTVALSHGCVPRHFSTRSVYHFLHSYCIPCLLLYWGQTHTKPASVQEASFRTFLYDERAV